MKALIVEDDYITSQVMNEIMRGFGECEIAEDGKIAMEKFIAASESGAPYELIFLDIMMPELDGQEVLTLIRQYEHTNGIMGLDCVKIVMTTALDDFDNVKNAFKSQCEGYLVKPIDKDKIKNMLKELNFID